MNQVKLDINIIGVINDTKFTAKGSGIGEDGKTSLKLEYSDIPKGWDPLVYSDPLINLSFLKEIRGARCLGMLTGPDYTAERVFDFGKGQQLRALAKIYREGGNVTVGSYSMIGTVHLPQLTEVYPFEEIMIPSGPGDAIGIGMLRFKAITGDNIDAVASTRYHFSKNLRIPFVQIRRAQIKAKVQERTFSGEFEIKVQPLPEMKKDESYIGEMCA